MYLHEILIDEFSSTSIPSIWDVGDVSPRLNLTPIALMEGGALAKTLFLNDPTKPDYRNSYKRVMITISEYSCTTHYEQWFHYDPRRLASNSSNDPCFLNAQKLRDAVTSFLQFNSCIAPVVLSNGYRMRQPEKVGEKAIKSSLTNDFNWANWIRSSVDCGVTVMYYISTISKCQNMAPCFTENTMKEYRAKAIKEEVIFLFGVDVLSRAGYLPYITLEITD
ncbi:unnamed protein product [Prunus brigantina]